MKRKGVFSEFLAEYGKRTFTTQFYGGEKVMKKRFENIFTRVRKKNGMAVLLSAVVLTLAAGMLLGFGMSGAGAAVRTGAKERGEPGDARIQTFTAEAVRVVTAVPQYDFEQAGRLGTVRELRGMLPGAAEGVWYMVLIDGVEYYYGAYDSGEAELFGYAVFDGRYALTNGISVGMTMAEALERYPNLAVVDFAGKELNPGITGHQGWNGMAYPRSSEGMDEAWAYGGTDYAWTDQFDCVMIADVETETKDALPVYAGFLVKDGVIAAITFYHPTAG